MSRITKNIIKLLAAIPVIAVFFILSSIIEKFKNPVINYPETVESFEETLSYEKILDNIISRMSIEEKIGQLIMINYYGDIDKELSDLFNEYGIGGIMLNAKNVNGFTYNELKERNKELISLCENIPLFISIDQEGGDVSRLDSVIDAYPSPQSLYSSKGTDGIIESADYFGNKLNDLNIKINFAPCIDAINRENTVIEGRSFTDNGSSNAVIANDYIAAISERGVLAVPKHFPGYGNVSLDPHYSVCEDDTENLDELCAPFYNIDSPEMIMTAHVIYSAYDDKPATLSSLILNRLRDNGFEGVIITDDLQMSAITALYDSETAAFMALEAGCDIALSVTKQEGNWAENAVNLTEFLRAKAEDGGLSESLIDTRLRRVLKLKLKYTEIAEWGILTEREKNYLLNQ